MVEVAKESVCKPSRRPEVVVVEDDACGEIDLALEMAPTSPDDGRGREAPRSGPALMARSARACRSEA